MSTNFEHLRERGLTQEIVFRGHLLRIRVDTVALPNGEIANREIVEHPGAVVIVPLTDDGQVLLVRQFRYAIGGLSLELPAGCLDVPGEEIESAARRELAEETGHRAERMVYLGKLHSSPGFTSETTYVFAAQGLAADASAHPTGDEFIDLLRVPLPEAHAMIRRGEITDAKTVAAMLWLEAFGLTSEQRLPTKGTLDDDRTS